MRHENVYETMDYGRGWYQDGQTLYCLYCEQSFTSGEVYPYQEKFLLAETAMTLHLQSDHHGPLLALLNQPRNFSGITEIQQTILTLFAQGLSDVVIAQRLEISSSTVRNHRFKLREKERQAKVFLSIMELLEQEPSTDYLLPHVGAKMIDDRYHITEKEREKILAIYQDEKGWIKQFPSKEKRKIILLAELVRHFDSQKNYSESAVNEILKQFIADFVTVRRYLIEYGFMDRTKDGQTYWVVD